MGVIAWIVLGLIVGLLAEKIVNGGDSHGLIVTTVIGVAGAVVGGWLATKLFHVDDVKGFFNISTWLTALAGAVVLLLVFHALTGRRSARR
ncbi:GlsB/YeaQ/YmgE family stress response membrane protein [Catenulispora sp. NF23]|uniref:GlsB/YeaQ/YmgE family stress response membrane protein n=1 Tax=Catenulispora pinistramenti TaxID=2705254 RepID=A0ABS5KNK4_9ACTN|nr:GlsB/YeaQ/YmgE family stress response membrane protein [Catenulispora pinistramenti]MBS2532647.1 GlsB/YeaQ/YmgE family stress response membrane protein [Catenulispora pinistramenti]MBS2547596.1 GlsB/YeaQ/YmgE family stress response membrane protein [Catenulispora pinistramenti]